MSVRMLESKWVTLGAVIMVGLPSLYATENHEVMTEQEKMIKQAEERMHTLLCDGDMDIIFDQKNGEAVKIRLPDQSHGVRAQWYEKDRLLVLKGGYYGTEMPKVHISGDMMANGFSKWHLDGRCALQAYGIDQQKELSLISNTQGDVSVQGYVKLKELEQKANNKIEIWWLDGEQAKINSQTGKLHLAGQVDKLVVSASGRAKIDAQYARAKVAWVNAKGQAQLKVAKEGQTLSHLQDVAEVLYVGDEKSWGDFNNTVERSSVVYTSPSR